MAKFHAADTLPRPQQFPEPKFSIRPGANYFARA
jgi:hypothetical protein